jgi:uncharacterized protein (DUF305 family)
VEINVKTEDAMSRSLVFAALISVMPMTIAAVQAQDMMMHMKQGAEMSEADKGYMAAMEKMQKDMMAVEMTGHPTADFARMMIPHHQSAIDMAEVLLKQKDVDPNIKTMAEKIKTDQQKEINELRAWLDEHKDE